MKFPELVKTLFNTPDNHTAKVILIGATNQQNFEAVWSKHDIEEYTQDMDANASKHKMNYTPVVVVVNEGADGHFDAVIALPTQKWTEGLRMDDSIAESKNIQRAADWLAGFMETFCMNDSITGIEVDTGTMVFGTGKHSLFNLENIMKDLGPKRTKDSLMTDAMDIGNVDDILAGQMTPEEIKNHQNPVEKAVEAAMAPPRLPVEVVPEPAPVDEYEAMRATQQSVIDKYGFSALEELLKATKQPLLVRKPKKA